LPTNAHLLLALIAVAALVGCAHPSTLSPYLERALTGHIAPVSAVAVTPGGRFAVSGSHDRTVRLWSLAKRDSYNP
jgi:WD40 repeat protein